MNNPVFFCIIKKKEGEYMKVTRLRPWVLIIIGVILLSGFIYYSYEVILWYKHVNENQEIQEKLEEKININIEESKYEIDFKALKEMNPDTVAYLKVNNTNINYVVVKGEDNSYYLNHNFEKKWNIAGWIFGDFRNHFDGTDKNLIIYGHSTKNGSMFDTLTNILKEEWYTNKENHIVTLVTEQGTFEYQVFSTYTVTPEIYYITTSFNDDNTFESFARELKSRSIYDYGVEVTSEDKMLTLSSCVGEGNKRVVLHAKLIKEEENDRD